MTKKQPPAPARTSPTLMSGTLLVALLVALFGRPLPSIAAAVIVLVIVSDSHNAERVLKALLRWPAD